MECRQSGLLKRLCLNPILNNWIEPAFDGKEMFQMSMLSQKEIIDICVNVAMNYICTECGCDFCHESSKEIRLQQDIMKRIDNREKWRKTNEIQGN